jgi:hypothetical protein
MADRDAASARIARAIRIDHRREFWPRCYKNLGSIIVAFPTVRKRWMLCVRFGCDGAAMTAKRMGLFAIGFFSPILFMLIVAQRGPAPVAFNPENTAAFQNVAIRLARLSEGPVRATIVSRGTLGQSVVCGADKERVARLMVSSRAVIQALGADQDTLDLADDVFKQGASMQSAGKGALCSEV